jgi:hypothetical protein
MIQWKEMCAPGTVVWMHLTVVGGRTVRGLPAFIYVVGVNNISITKTLLQASKHVSARMSTWTTWNVSRVVVPFDYCRY